MLSPNSGDRIVLLPCDREIIELAGITEKEYREFVRHCRFNSKIRPGTPVAIGLDIVLLQIGIALVLSAAAYLLTPKPSAQRSSGTPRLESRQVDGQNIVRGNRVAPKAGFDQLQNVVEMGSVVPLIFAHRETIDGETYGGVRVNTNLLWSQVLSLGGDQLLRGVYLLGEGDTRPNSMEIDANQFAFGNNLLGSYDLAQNATQSRISIYYSNDGGRLTSQDYLAGRIAANDPGNAQNQGAADVFQVRGPNGVFGTNFSYAYRPSTQTSFGVFAWIGNGVCFKTNPSLRPGWSPTLVPTGNANALRVACSEDGQEQVRRLKDEFDFPGRSGIVAGGGAVAVGDVIQYVLNSQLSRAADFTYAVGGNVVGDRNSELSSGDANSAVAARQNNFDENIVVGELYRIGSVLAICTSRTGAPFGSQADTSANNVSATFEVVRAGQTTGGIDTLGSATQNAQIFRVSLGTFVTEYPCQVLELGLRSTLGIQIRGQTNMREVNSDYGSIDQAACIAHNGNNVANNQTLVVQNFRAGQINTPETRYSFFRIRYRIGGSNNAYTDLPQLFGVRSDTNAPIYNYIRFEMPSINRWEFEIEPISGWEIRSQVAAGSLEVLDPKVDTERVVQTAGSDPVTVRYNGVTVARSRDVFNIRNTNAIEPRLWLDGDARAGDWARLAEAFTMNELQSSVGGNPEHDIVYVNTILPNAVAPDYADLALVGMNIRASREFANLAQFSAYMNRGIGGFHDFPSVYRELLTNTRWGTGEIVSPKQIDEPSFTAMTTWTRNRRYFYDGVISEKLNLRTWGTEMARNFLLDLVMRNGQFYLQPLVEFDGAEPITGIFTAGNIIEDSFQLNYFDQDQRQAPRVSVRWREEKRSTDAAERGLFPVVREVTVRENFVAADAPLEQIDMSDFCTSEIHAVDRAKFECRFRRISTHQVSFKTTTDQAALQLGKCFKLGMETLTYEQPTNGYIARDGTVTSWPELADGNYNIVTWDGTNSQVVEANINISGGKADGSFGAVFCVANSIQSTETYKVQSLSFDEDGNLDVEAIHWPTNAVGVSNITDGWNVDGNWVIEGEIGNTDSPINLNPTFDSATIVGPEIVVAGIPTFYSVVVNGPQGNYTYNWTPNGVPDDGATSAITLAVPGVGDPVPSVSCAVTLGGTTHTPQKFVTVIAAINLGTYTYDAVSGADNAATVNVAKEYDITDVGSDVTNQVYSHSCIAAPAGTDLGDVVIASTSDQEAGERAFSSASYTFPAAGNYTIQCVITSTTANANNPTVITQAVTVT